MITYCKYFYPCFIAGEVLFNCNYPEDPPDFIFGSEDVDFFPNIENIKVCVYGNLKTLSEFLEDLVKL